MFPLSTMAVSTAASTDCGFYMLIALTGFCSGNSMINNLLQVSVVGNKRKMIEKSFYKQA